MTEQDGMMIDNGSMFLACDTIINFMSNVSDLIFWKVNFLHAMGKLIFLGIFVEEECPYSSGFSFHSPPKGTCYMGWYALTSFHLA
jgi:hypothetical protein